MQSGICLCPWRPPHLWPSSAWLRRNDPMSPATHDRLQPGMTEAEVGALFGLPPGND